MTPEQIAKRFQIAGNEVYDRKTDLTWQRCDFGQTWDDANAWCRGVKKHGNVDALAEAARAAAPGWRLPTIDELTSMMETACRTQPKDVAPVFPELDRGSGTAYYLSATAGADGDHVLAQQCFGSMMMSPAGLGRKWVAVTRLVHSGPIASH
jgi:hypothetical protein